MCLVTFKMYLKRENAGVQSSKFNQSSTTPKKSMAYQYGSGSFIRMDDQTCEQVNMPGMWIDKLGGDDIFSCFVV